MARPHHRKKHREHLRQYKQRDDTAVGKAWGKASTILAVTGFVFGLGISYIATQGDTTWMIVATVVCTVGGYFIGRMIDNSN